MQHESAGEVPLVDACVDVEPDRRRLDDRVGELGLALELHEVAQKPERREQTPRAMPLLAESFRGGKVRLDHGAGELGPWIEVLAGIRGWSAPPHRHQPRGVPRARRPAQRKYLIPKPRIIDLLWPPGGQRLLQAPAQGRRVLDQP
jgi:hypothetical protein